MLLINEKRLTGSMIEDLGRISDIEDTGLSYDEYKKRVLKELKAPDVIAPKGKIVGSLKLSGLRVLLYMSTGKPMNVRDYAEWLGKEVNRGVRDDFNNGQMNIKEVLGENFSLNN